MSTLKTLSGAGLLARALVCIALVTLALLGVSVALLIAEGFGLILWFDVFASSACSGTPSESWVCSSRRSTLETEATSWASATSASGRAS